MLIIYEMSHKKIRETKIRTITDKNNINTKKILNILQGIVLWGIYIKNDWFIFS